MASGALMSRLVHRGGWDLSWCSHCFQGAVDAEAGGAQEGSWSRCRERLALHGNQAFPSGE
jgi:hypothetical protein